MGYQQNYGAVTVVDANTFATGYRYVGGVLSTVSIPVPFLYGTKLTTGIGVPSLAGVAAGDLYLNILTSDIYQWSGTAWSTNPIMTLVGGSLQIPIWIYGPPVNGEVVYELQASAGFTLPISLTNSQASADTASTGTAVFTLYQNGTSIGTITFTASATGVFAFAASATFVAGDVLKVVAPATADATLANIRINLYGAQAGSAIVGTPAAAASAAAAAASAASSLTYSNNSSASATTSSTQAGIATTQASNAAASATTATTQAGIATTQAGIATTQATNAAASAAAAVTTLSTSLLKANNLTDVANATTARGNLSAAKSGANSDITAITGLTTALGGAYGGTGRLTLTAHYVLVGNGTGAITMVAPSATVGQALLSAGASADPAFGVVPIAGGGTGAITAPLALAALGAVPVAASGRPYFAAHKTTTQTIAGSTWAKIDYETEDGDSNGLYDNVTNFRFTPNVAGWYYAVVNTTLTATSATVVACAVYKNGVSFAEQLSQGVASCSCMVLMNGTTDYLEGWGWCNGSTNPTTSAINFFQAFYVGP